MDQEAFVKYTVRELVGSDELVRSLIGCEVGWIDPCMGSSFRYNGKIAFATVIYETLHVMMLDGGDFYMGTGTISVR